MRVKFLLVFIVFCLFCQAQKEPIKLQIDYNKTKGEMKPIWAWFGYDEPNYTYMKDGKKLLSELAALSPVPVYVRTHNLMTSGDGTPSLKWGSTNMYTEDKNGNAIYNWTIIDSIFDAYVERGMKPLAQIGFMPEALSQQPIPYKHNWNPADKKSSILAGWIYPPDDYKKWSELIFQWVNHCVSRYGKSEVDTWYWELWNEPNSRYFEAKEKLKEYCKMYDYACDAVKRALPSARMGGPHTTGDGHLFVRDFINHCLKDTNAVTGKIGTPLDFVAFHAKGSPRLVDGHVQMGMLYQLQHVNNHLKVIASFPETKNLPVIIGESDPEGCAACGMQTHPQNAYRNGTMYSSYTAASIPRIIDFNDYYGTNVIGAVNWSFEFENQPWFYGYRDLATNGVDKPVLNVFRMLGMMKGNRLQVTGNTSYNFLNIRDSSVRGAYTDVNAMASGDKKTIGVLLWNYHDDDIQDNGSPVELTIKNIPANKVTLTHYQIDANHSNSYELWKKMGSPQLPTSEQIAELEKAGQLALLEKPKNVSLVNNVLDIKMQLPRQAVSFLKLEF